MDIGIGVRLRLTLIYKKDVSRNINDSRLFRPSIDISKGSKYR